ncbi:hypothetical protein BH11ARM2_BH11ARM2_13240 [soil metagenome]
MRLALRTSAVAASLGLASITLGVFGVLYDYGPGSAIRQFHEALTKDDRVELSRVIVPPKNPAVARQMLGFLSGLAQNGDIRIAATQRFDREVRAIVSYRDTDGNQFPVVFVVVKPDRQWQIDLDKTATIVQDMLVSRH